MATPELDSASPTRAQRLLRQPSVLMVAGAALVLLVFVAGWIVGRRTPTGEKPPKVATAGASNATPGPPVATPAPSLPDAAATLFVTSNPQGALVRFDGKLGYPTPAVLEKVAPGLHVLAVEMLGYENYIEQLNVDGDRSLIREVKLVRSMGSLSVRTNDPSAIIRITGVEQPMTTPGNWKSDHLPTGDYFVSVTRNGWKPIGRAVAVLQGQESVLSFDLSPGSVTITSNPPKASVTAADGKVLGKTPLTVPEVEPGSVRYTLSLSGYRSEPLIGTLGAGQSLQLSGKLVKGSTAKSAPSRSGIARTGPPFADDQDDFSKKSKFGLGIKRIFGFGDPNFKPKPADDRPPRPTPPPKNPDETDPSLPGSTRDAGRTTSRDQGNGLHGATEEVGQNRLPNFRSSP